MSEKSGPLIHSDTGQEVKKQFFISVPYFPGLSESFKKTFRYTAIQIYFKGVNKISIDQKKDVVYHWECQADSCRSSYIGESSRALGERVKEHCKSSTSAILKHCTDHHHPLPTLSNFNIIDKDPSQVTWEAKKAIHIQRLDPNLKRNIVKISIPHCFDPLLGVKPKHPQADLLSQAQKPVDETTPPSQIPGLNLTQFHNIGTFRPNLINKISKHSNRACRTKNLLN